jgi:hypothetical protein
VLMRVSTVTGIFSPLVAFVLLEAG